ncbi:MAG: hypothetical protein QHD01_24355 [Bradyrhizobium sp.]|uniref:hypothetical protein n=1 Tax=Bradyrhizobium sp. TaxID=376 RepID=UPI0029A4D37B|nr:hypothetical protein [Bradyrhizobium sp.]MDX3969706.1 hypothetical protein [Bradyrhizobium sp.]
MKTESSLIVRAAPGRQLDLLRGEASRIAKANDVNWYADRADVGTRFCFDNDKAKLAFALICDEIGVSYQHE